MVPLCVSRVSRISLGQVTHKVAVDLSGPAQTMLTTLYCKALDADLDRPVLGDGFAKEAVGRIDYDWGELKVGVRWTPLVTVRTAQYDIWASQFLAVHQHATVVHLGCGLDCRVFRLDPGPGVEWYDIDQPAVIALREKVFPTRLRYHLIAASATDPSWLEQIPADRPVLLLAEGISMYLTQHDGVALLQRVVDRFRWGELQIDFYNGLAIKSQKTHRLQRQSGSTLHWAVNSPQDILDQVSGVRLLTAATFFDASTFSRVPTRFRVGSGPARALPPLRRMFQYHRYAFGPVN
jgi:O-methyltransferase involved in polyketide biosynthesis